MPMIIPITPSAVTGFSTPGGALFVSGQPSGFSGPWAVETQILTVQYARVPQSMALVSGSAERPFSLSADHIRTTEILQTALNVVATATVKVIKDYNSYSTSSHQQPQRFSILSESDQYGNTYGSNTAGVSYVLGPAGTIVTSQPYLRRVPWVDGVHVETVSSIVGSNLLVSGINPLLNYAATYLNPQVALSDFKRGINQGYRHCYIGVYDSEPVVQNYYYWYLMTGPYSRSKENDLGFISFMDNLGMAIKYGILRGQWTPGVHFSATWPYSPLVSHIVSLPTYSISRHVYV